MPYKLTHHAAKMIEQRNLCPMAVNDALEGRRLATLNGLTRCYDNRSRVMVIVDERTGKIITCYRALRKQVKQVMSR